MLNLNSPDRWFWVLAALPIIAFFLLRTRLRRRPIATLLFWEQVFQHKRPRALGGQLRHFWSLLLQLTFLGLVVAALLDPLGAAPKKRTRQIVLVLDASASMQAIDEEGSRWAAALDVAADEVAAMRAGDQMALVSAGSPEEVVVGLTEFGPAIRDALKSIQPTDGPTRIDAAIGTARQLATDIDRRDIVVISDGGYSAETHASLQSATDVRVHTIGQAVANVAITQFQTRRSLVDPIGYAVLVEVIHQTDATEPLECRLILELEGELIDVQPLRLTPGEPWRKTFQDASATGGVLTASLDVHDALAVDNQARAILPPRAPLPVNLITETENVFLTNALAAIPLVQVTTSNQAIVPAPPKGITVMYKTVPQDLPDGPLLFIDPQQDSPFWKLGEAIADPVVAEQDTRSPLLSHVRLDNVTIPGARSLQMNPGSTPLLTTPDGSVLMASLLDTRDPLAVRRVVVLSAQLDEGDLPLRVAFPVMMTNVVNWLADDSGNWEPALATGQLAVIPTGPPAESGEPTSDSLRWVLQGPLDLKTAGPADLPASAVLSDRHDATLGPLRQAGVYALRRQHAAQATEERPLRLAVNLSDRAESDLRRPFDQTVAAPQRQWSGGRPAWFYLILLALGFIVGEWVLYQRRMVG